MNKKRQIANLTGLTLVTLSLVGFFFFNLLFAVCENASYALAIFPLFALGATFGVGIMLIFLAFFPRTKKVGQFNQKKENDKNEKE